MKIAVTAANGQLGSSIVHELIQAIGKEQVVGIVRTPEKAAHLGIEVRKGDYNSREDFNTTLKRNRCSRANIRNGRPAKENPTA
jgi:NAD(P)H dehydrogenase (quinone)